MIALTKLSETAVSNAISAARLPWHVMLLFIMAMPESCRRPEDVTSDELEVVDGLPTCIMVQCAGPGWNLVSLPTRDIWERVMVISDPFASAGRPFRRSVEAGERSR